MLTLEQIIEKLDDKNLTQVAKNVGLSPQTLWRIKNRVTGDNVSYETVKTLSDYLEEGAVTA
jgi:transcriptional regulator with XRE-family HTH domain